MLQVPAPQRRFVAPLKEPTIRSGFEGMNRNDLSAHTEDKDCE